MKEKYKENVTIENVECYHYYDKRFPMSIKILKSGFKGMLHIIYEDPAFDPDYKFISVENLLENSSFLKGKAWDKFIKE